MTCRTALIIDAMIYADATERDLKRIDAQLDGVELHKARERERHYRLQQDAADYRERHAEIVRAAYHRDLELNRAKKREYKAAQRAKARAAAL